MSRSPAALETNLSERRVLMELDLFCENGAAVSGIRDRFELDLCVGSNQRGAQRLLDRRHARAGVHQ